MKNGWAWSTIGECCELTSGGTPSKQNASFWNGNVPFVSARDLKSDQIETAFLHISREAVEQSATKLAPVGSLLMLVRGMGLANGIQIGEVTSPVAFNQDIRAILPPKARVVPRFLLLALKSSFMQGEAERVLSSAAHGTLKIDTEALRRIAIPLPPLAEQRRIVGILDEAFEGLATAKANAEQNLQNARALFESHLQAVFTQLRSAHPVRRLSDLCERITKGSSPTWQGMAYVDRPGVLFVTSENVHENRLVVNTPKYVEERFNEKEKRSILKFGDVLTNLVGASIGRTAVYDLHDVANINQAVGVIRCHADRIHNHFLMYFFNSPVMKAFFHANEVNNARANISLTFVSELEVPLPPVEDQKAVVGCIREYHQNCQRLEALYQRKLAALDELKKSLLHRAFSGQL